MKLSYRGIRYSSHPVAGTTKTTPAVVNYRGLAYRGIRHHFHTAEAAPKAAPVVAKYRGLTYRVPQVALGF